MAYSKTSLINKIRVILNDNPYLDAAAEAMDTTETGLDVADGTLWSAGDIVEFQDDGEQCYVTSVATNTLNVIRNYHYSVTATAGTGTSHNNGVQIAKNPVYLYATIVEHISEVLNGLWPYVYREVNQTLTPDTTVDYYEMDEAASNATKMRELSSVIQLYGTSPVKIFRYGEHGNAYPAKLVFNVPTASWASGVALWLPYLKDITNSIFVNAIGPIDDTVGTGSYTYIDAGIQADCVAYYVASRLILSGDAWRTMAEDVTMGDQSVTPGQRTRLSAYYEQKATQYRHQWEEELRITLPRMPKYRKSGRRQA